MRRTPAPLRFLGMAIGGWTIGRLLFLLPDLSGEQGRIPERADGAAVAPSPPAAADEPALPRPADRPSAAPAMPPAARRSGKVMIAAGELGAAPDSGERWASASVDLAPVAPPSLRPPVPSPTSAPAASSRWSGSAWLHVRPDEGRPALAAGGQLGGSQAGARIAYRLADPGRGSLAAAARLSTPLEDTRGAEAAVGLDWRPVAAIPIRLSIERRIGLGREGRNAWSAHAAGGFWRGGLPAGLEVDGYGQAGMVGARSRDLFADGALRAGSAIPLPGDRRLVLGGGVWAAAQPGASRLDIGPRAAIGLPLAGATLTGALDWRIRAAGHAAPGSGVAFTLAADF